MRLNEFELEKLKYIGEVSRRNDWSWYSFYLDPEQDVYYVAKWELCGVDLSGEKTSGGWPIPKEHVMKEASDEYIRLLDRYCGGGLQT